MGKMVNYIAGIFLASLLVLLTVGLPVAYNTIKKEKEKITQKCEKDANPYANANEEKTITGTISGEEYVHQTNHEQLFIKPMQISIAYIHAHEALYQAYHGELHYPPPNC